jgi:hypothetical protein
MIWFNCKKCGKVHGRADASAGTMIFCDCGNGNTVPWESTAAEPLTPAVVQAPKVPDLAPIQFEPVLAPATPAAANAPSYPTYPSAPPPAEERPARRSRGERRDPEFCFNHQRVPKVQDCADCKENFCADCLVKFQDAMLCGACKNFRVRRQELLPAASTMAVASLIIALMLGPLTMCLLIGKPESDMMRVICWLFLLPQVLAVGLGAWALWDAEKECKGGGQWVAVTGIATAGMTCVLMLLLQVFANRFG